MTPEEERAAEIAVVRYVLGIVDLTRALCMTHAPRVSIVLAAAALKIREMYPDVDTEGPEA